MTAAASPPASPQPARSGFHVPVWVFAVLGGLLVLVVGFGIGRRFADNHDHGDHMRRFGERFGDHGGGHPVLGLILVLIVLGLAIAGVVLLVRSRRSSTAAVGTGAAAPVASTTSAEQLLAERFARGEIDAAEFQSRRDALRG